jgi:RNA polymerase-associated protein CTR9
VDIWPDFTLAHFGLGQMYLVKGETAKAISSFEAVLKKHSDNYETLKILASLYAHSGKRDKAIHLFRRITETHPQDTEAWIELGDLVERQKNYTEALKAYEKATSLLQAQNEPVSIEVRCLSSLEWPVLWTDTVASYGITLEC